MNYVTYGELISDSHKLAYKAPRDIAGVLGIPRSGMVPASIIAQELGVPLGSTDTFATTGLMQSGDRLNWEGTGSNKILVVDDSVYKGSAMIRAHEELSSVPNTTFISAALYVNPEHTYKVDYFVREVRAPRLFAWNYLHHGIIEHAFLDMDGILCVDPIAPDRPDNLTDYEESLKVLAPLHIPKRKIKAIVTGRMAFRRNITEEWLAKNGVKYGELRMPPFKTVEERKAYKAFRWKAEEYSRADDAQLFIESEPYDAEKIAILSGKPVLCPQAERIFV